MEKSDLTGRLEADHTPAAVRRRIREPMRPSYFGDAVLGSIDGCITTFAIAAGAVGGRLTSTVVVILGIANLVADGFSMAASNFLAAKSEHDTLARVRAEEDEHISRIPEGEREEVRAIYEAKGFKDPELAHIVDVISRDRDLWIDTMIKDEHGLQLQPRSPMRAAGSTMLAFLLVGLIPLLPFLSNAEQLGRAFAMSCIATAIAFFVVGALRGRWAQRSIWAGGFETLAVGGSAAVLAYAVGYLIRWLYDTV